MKDLLMAVKMMGVMTVLLGLIYPLAMTGLAQEVFPSQASGSLIIEKDKVIASKLIGQKFTKPEYFWGRPSATDYNPLPSGGSNLSLNSAALQEAIATRKTQLAAAHPGEVGPNPQDLLYASASGLDPQISPAAASYQVVRVATARGLTVEKVQELVKKASASRQWGLFGEPTVNVVQLNLSLDQLKTGE
jgi:K+-transporting ATPase ATPase C chain